MTGIFNIFEVDKKGVLLWVKTAETLKMAKARVTEMLKMNPTREYVIFSQRTPNKIYFKEAANEV